MSSYFTESFQNKNNQNNRIILELELNVKSTSIIEQSEFCKMSTECKKLAEAIVYEARGELEEGKYADEEIQ